MQVKHSWLSLLGTFRLALLPLVRADAQISDPNLSVTREFNVVLTDNTKLYDLSCCMGATNEIKDDPRYKCFTHQDLAMSNAPGARRVGIQFCHHLPGWTPPDASRVFEDTCKLLTGEVITVDNGFCPQIWPNYQDGYKKKAPATPADATPAPPPVSLRQT